MLWGKGMRQHDRVSERVTSENHSSQPYEGLGPASINYSIRRSLESSKSCHERVSLGREHRAEGQQWAGSGHIHLRSASQIFIQRCPSLLLKAPSKPSQPKLASFVKCTDVVYLLRRL